MSTVAQVFRGWEAFDMSILPSETLRSLARDSLRELNKRNDRDVAVLRAEREALRRPLKIDLESLLAEDWSSLFPGGNQERKYYVYAHVCPSRKISKSLRYRGMQLPLGMTGVPFYIGKGCGNRAYDLSRNEGHGAELRALLAAGHSPDGIVNILRRDLAESEALELESKLVYFFGTKFELRKRGMLVNLDVPQRPAHRVR